MRFIPLFGKQYIGILLIALTIISCKKDGSHENGSPEKATPVLGSISYFAKASGIKTAAIKSDTAINSDAVDWSSASIYVEKIAFTGKSSKLLDTTIIVEKNLNIFSKDALAGVIQLPPGSYKDAKVKMFCKKSAKSEMAFNFRGTFINTKGGEESVMVGSSYPFEANLTVSDIVIDPSGKYKATFNFDLNKVLTGITNTLLETARSYTGTNNKKTYVIWKGGSAEEAFYDQVIQNWQTVASVLLSKE